MNTLLLIIFLLSFPAIIYFTVRCVISHIKHNNIHSKKMLKLIGVSVGVMVVSFIGFVVTISTDEKEVVEKIEVSAEDKTELKEEEEEEEEEEVKPASELTEEEKAELEKKATEEKTAAEAKRKAETEQKEKEKAANAKRAIEAEKEYYVKEIVPQIEGVIGVYDQIWNTLWVPTFEGIANGTVDLYTAYDNMKQLEFRYQALSEQISNINGDNLSKDNKKELDSFKSNLKDAASLRRSAGNEAKKMLDKGTFTPSEIDKVMTTVGYADSPMLQAVVSKTTIDMDLGLLEE